MYRRIAVPVDGTAASRQAIPWATTIARRAKCPIDLVHVAYPAAVGTELYGAAVMQPDDVEAIRQIAQRDLQTLADQIAIPGVAVTATVLTGELPKSLIDHLETTDTDLVIMTTHDAGRIERLLIGSVAESVVRHLHLPVLLVREDDTAPAALDAARTIKRMLIALDGSPFGDEILPHASKLASVLRSEVTLVGVMQPVLAVAGAAADAGPTAAVIPMRMREDVPDPQHTESDTSALEQSAASLRSSGLAVHTKVLVDGQPARAIVDYTRRKSIDAIAMTTHGRGALERIVAGSVSQRVLRTSNVPMLLYRPRD